MALTADPIVEECECCRKKALYDVEPSCRACNYPVAARSPNVTFAKRFAPALEERYRIICDALEKGGAQAALTRFQAVAGRTTAVVNLEIDWACAFFNDARLLYTTYGRLVEAGVRAPANFDQDRQRRGVDGVMYGMELGVNEAWISARAGCAVVVTDTDHFLLEAGREAPPKPCAPGRLNNLWVLASDVTRMEAESFPFPKVKAALDKAWEEQSALDFTLMSVDSKLSRSLRENAAQVASQLLESEEVREAVRRRLLGTPLPDEADIEGAPREGVVADLVQEAAENRELVAMVDKAWDRVFWEHYSSSELRRLKRASVVSGGFAAVVDVILTGDEAWFQRWLKGQVGILAQPLTRSLLSTWRTTASRLFEDARAEPVRKAPMRYVDFELQFDTSSSGGFLARVLKSPCGEGVSRFSLPLWDVLALPLALSAEAADGISRDVGQLAAPSSPGVLLPLDFGTELFRSVFHGQVRTLLDMSRGQLEQWPECGLRLKIKLDPNDEATAALAVLPWELLRDSETEEFFALSSQTSLVRYLDVPRSPQPIPFTPPLRILAAIATPHNLPSLNLEDETRRLEDLSRRSSRIEVQFLAHASAMTVREALCKDDYNVFYFTGHGTFDRDSGEEMLIFEGADGSPDLVSGRAFATQFKDLRSLGVVVLNACNTARFYYQKGVNPFQGVATSLVLGGVPAVVAMQGAISDRAAMSFSDAFYRHLARGDSIDAALTEGRQAIHIARPKSFDWATPVLFLRVPEGKVFVAKPSGRLGRFKKIGDFRAKFFGGLHKALHRPSGRGRR